MSSTPTILLIDADSLMWSSCFAPKEVDEKFETDLDEVEYRFNEKLMYIENSLEEQYGGHFDIQARVLFFEGAGNFRKAINPEYKANRKDVEIPPLLQPLKDLIRTKEAWVNIYHTFESHNVETDDSLVATYKKWKGNGYEIIICSSDKDLRTIPCLVYDYYHTRQELLNIDEETARHNFFVQMLVGDRADNVKGIKGLGVVKAGKALNGCSSTFSYLKAVYGAYLKEYGRNAKLEFVKAYNMLKLVDEKIHTPSLDEVMF